MTWEWGIRAFYQEYKGKLVQVPKLCTNMVGMRAEISHRALETVMPLMKTGLPPRTNLQMIPDINATALGPINPHRRR